MKSRNLRFKLKMPVALMLIGTIGGTSAWAVQAPALKDAPLPNYDVRVGYSSLNLNDPRVKEESKALRAQKSALNAKAFATKALPVATSGQKNIEKLFGKDVNAIFNEAGIPSLLFNEKGPLTAPVSLSAENAAQQFLQNYQEVFGLNSQEIRDIYVVRTLTSGLGSKQVNLRQMVAGLPVFGADIKVGLNKDHAVLSVGGKFYPGLQVSGAAALSAAQAVEQAAAHVGEWSSNGSVKSAKKVWDNTVYLKNWNSVSLAEAKMNTVSKPQILKTEDNTEHTTIVSHGPFQSDIIASQVVFPLNKSQGRLAWQISLHKSMTEWYQLIVDAENGNLLNRTNLVQFANEQGNVFVKNPGSTPLSVQSMLGAAPATSGSFAFAGSSGQAGNNVFMMIGANQKPGTTHDYTYPFANSYLNTGALQTINLGTNRKLAFSGNGSGGYSMTKTTLTALPAGTNLGLTDDSAACGAVGFAFNFFAKPVSNVCVNSNGNLTFETADTNTYYPDPLEQPQRGRIMPLQTNLNPGAGGTVSVDTSVAGRLCFIWSNVPEYGVGGSNSFSACLLSNNSIWLQYPTGGITATAAVVGIRPPAQGSSLTSVPSGASAWASMDANVPTRGKTGLTRYLPDMGADENVLGTNLFWQFNKIHDRHWINNGFTDTAGNFQLTNTNGGIGSDPVMLSGLPAIFGTNNAFFGTPPEGQCCGYSGFFLFTGPSNGGPFRNVHSGFDSDVTLHEYAHGVTNRLVGGSGNPVALMAQQSGALGEGWSDFYAFSYTGDYVIGEYSTGNATTGIRRVAYTATNGRDLGQYGSIYGPFGANAANVYLPEVHDDGEIWASLLADVRRSLTTPVASGGAGLTGLAVEKLVTEALFFTPPNPGMVEAANALLIADVSLYGGTHTCRLWNVMRLRGFGKHAANNDIDPSYLMSGNSYSVFAGRDRPTGCGGSYNRGTLKYGVNFDGATVGATTANGWTGNGLWHVTARRFSNGTKSFYYGQEATGNYDTGAATYGSVVSPTMNLSGTANPVLEFDVAMKTENYFPYDTLWVQLSTDNGATFPIQRSMLTYTTYDFYYGDIKFQHVRIDLKPLKGISTAKVRLYFDSLDNTVNAYEGVYVDNIQVRDYVEN